MRFFGHLEFPSDLCLAAAGSGFLRIPLGRFLGAQCMLGTLPTPILLDIAVLFTALSWGLGFFIADRKVHLFASLAIGCFVCLFGYSVESVGAPPWAVVAAPVPLDILLLWYVLRRPRKMAVAYVSTWAIYIVLHILLSSLLRYDSLIPAWRLHR
jgi:hypothetical protein